MAYDDIPESLCTGHKGTSVDKQIAGHPVTGIYIRMDRMEVRSARTQWRDSGTNMLLSRPPQAAVN
jgi:hypothetical protein